MSCKAGIILGTLLVHGELLGMPWWHFLQAVVVTVPPRTWLTCGRLIVVDETLDRLGGAAVFTALDLPPHPH